MVMELGTEPGYTNKLELFPRFFFVSQVTSSVNARRINRFDFPLFSFFNPSLYK